jgi:hypothetical protein
VHVHGVAEGYEPDSKPDVLSAAFVARGSNKSLCGATRHYRQQESPEAVLFTKAVRTPQVSFLDGYDNPRRGLIIKSAGRVMLQKAQVLFFKNNEQNTSLTCPAEPSPTASQHCCQRWQQGGPADSSSCICEGLLPK